MLTTVESLNNLNQYDRILRPFAFNLTKSREATEDLIQDTFYRALANREKFAEGTNIKAWLFTIMKNIFINNYRKNQKRKMVQDNSEGGTLIENSVKSIRNEAENTFLGENIREAINKVNKDFTVPFMMYYEGFKYQEIAEQLDLPLGTVKSRIFFARKEIQARLRPMGITHSAN